LKRLFPPFSKRVARSIGVRGERESVVEKSRIDRLVEEIKKQLFPYSLEHDIERSCDRWKVGNEDCVTSWVVEQLRSCRKKNKCDKRSLCVYYSHGDLARRNFDICREIIILIENGDVNCRESDKKPE